MKRIFALCSLLFPLVASAQSTEDYVVELSASVQAAPPRITLNWKRIATGTPGYQVYRKAKTASAWGAAVATLPATDSSWTDTNVVADSAYEYQVLTTGASYTGTGYIWAGVRNPAIHNRGTLLLLVDSTFTDSCRTGLKKLMNNISGDGWQLVRHDLPRSMADTAIKNRIVADYNRYPSVKAVLIVGHLAVPYSGDLNPDGHPDHLGAWPADVYYACINGTWTDASVNDPASSYPANQNIPGDGKWDQVYLPAATTLQVSRVDFSNMPAFSATEVQMMNKYLDRDHTYKMDSLPMRHRGIISDNFGAFSGEAFAQNGWRNMAPLVGRDSISAGSLVSALSSATYQWLYGCGGGSFTSAGGIGTTTDYTTNPVNGIFGMTFGSYFGDWNVQNNFLRAPMCASTPLLTNCWAGRPNWFMHHMALGENIGYGAQLTQNNNALYQPPNYGASWVHVALLGDLTLRTDYIKPITNMAIAKPVKNGAILSWTASPDAAVLGYYVYRADSAYGYFKRVSGMVAAITFHDTAGTNGLKYYMVRPVKLQNTPSGGYYNLGIGVADTGTISFKQVMVASASPVAPLLELFPNPAASTLQVAITSQEEWTATMYISNMAGQQFKVATRQLRAGSNLYSVPVADLAPGIYLLNVVSGNGTVVSEKWVKQ